MKEIIQESNLSMRIQRADLDPTNRYGLKEVMGDAGYEEFQKVDPNAIADEDLFE